MHAGQALQDRKYIGKIIGTAGGWFLFDITFYGTYIYVPHPSPDAQQSRLTMHSIASQATASSSPAIYMCPPIAGNGLFQSTVLREVFKAHERTSCL